MPNSKVASGFSHWMKCSKKLIARMAIMTLMTRSSRSFSVSTPSATVTFIGEINKLYRPTPIK